MKILYWFEIILKNKIELVMAESIEFATIMANDLFGENQWVEIHEA